MQNQTIYVIWQLFESTLQHIRNLFEIRMAAKAVTNDLSVKQINDRRQVELLVVDFEFGNVCDSFSIWLVCFKVSFQ